MRPITEILSAQPFETVPDEEAGHLISCAGKSGFGTPEQARAVIARMRLDRGGPMDIYRCRHCGKWHIGAKLRKG